jgi:hypothetical protein
MQTAANVTLLGRGSQGLSGPDITSEPLYLALTHNDQRGLDDAIALVLDLLGMVKRDHDAHRTAYMPPAAAAAAYGMPYPPPPPQMYAYPALLDEKREKKGKSKKKKKKKKKKRKTKKKKDLRGGGGF